MKRVKVLWLMMVLGLAASCFVGGCAKDDDGGGGSDYYMQFKYNGKSHKITSSVLAYYTTNEVEGEVVSYMLVAEKESIGIRIDVLRQVEAGKSYDIVTRTIDVLPNIRIELFSEEEFIDQSYQGYDSEPTKVGELTITKLTETVMEGKFSCETNDGKITDGKFRLRNGNDMYDW
ncbi:MAG: hypothetical protein LBH84_02970 [Prevotellaceae bacterium]|nr:hypothetical protein [Prevotellaceae bacterium]